MKWCAKYRGPRRRSCGDWKTITRFHPRLSGFVNAEGFPCTREGTATVYIYHRPLRKLKMVNLLFDTSSVTPSFSYRNHKDQS